MMKIIIAIVVCASFSLPSFAGYDFCDKKCHANDGVTCTEAESCTSHERCRNVTTVGLTKLEKLAILSEINDLRKLVANGFFKMPASNMRTIIWNNDLEELAQCWAMQCETIYDKCTENSDNVSYGQLINVLTRSYLKYGQITAKQIAVDQWWSEHNGLEITSTLIDTYNSKPKARNFTQLLWAETYSIGCGLTVFEKQEGDLEHFLVCNFEPKGNVLRKPIFKRGPPCSACPNYTACDVEVPGLCRNAFSLRSRNQFLMNKSNRLLNDTIILGINLKITAVFIAMVLVCRRMNDWFNGARQCLMYI